jgi:hypothetical protein
MSNQQVNDTYTGPTKPSISSLGSYATRHFHFEINPKHAKKYNEFYKKDRKLSIQLILVGIGFGLLSYWLYSFGTFWMILLGVITTLLFLILVLFGLLYFKKVGTPTSVLKRGVLNPGIIAEIDNNGIGLLILAEVTAKSHPKWGLYSIRLKQLPTHDLKIGERVPVTCIYGATSDDGEYSTSISPYPIAWGTENINVVRQAALSINEFEWNALEKNIEKYDFKEEYSATERLKLLSDEEMYRLSLDKVSE